jgi:hypothetical protein
VINTIYINFLFGMLVWLPPKTISDYFRLFPHKPDFISLDKDDEHTRVTIDEKNAYIAVSYDDADYGFEYGGTIEFTYFVRSDKRKIFAYSEFFEGPSSISTDTKFFTYNGQWSEVSVLPPIALENFTDSGLVDSVGTEYSIRYVLPQQGTDLTLTVQPVGENNAPFAYDQYLSFIQSLKALTLQWNKQQGTFELKAR